ncbi:MAG: type IX secretion system membrane protein PorP/SprF [Marinilabiliales bacterium]
MKYLLYILFFIVTVPGFSQYYPGYSQYMFNGLAINPAYAGSREVLSMTGSSRNQWLGFKGAPKTYYFSAHTPLMKNRLGLGFQIINDNIAVSHNTIMQLNYAYRFPLRKGHFSLGLSTSLQFLSSYWQDIYTIDNYDVVFEKNYHETMLNFGVGIYYYTPDFYFGLSSPLLLPYQQEIIVSDSVNLSANNYLITSGHKFKMNKYWSIEPSFLFKIFPEQAAQLDLNCNVSYNNVIWTGFSLRSEDAFVWLFEIKVLPQLQIGYTHDFTFSKIRKYSDGTNEFFLRYEVGYKTNAKPIKYY